MSDHQSINTSNSEADERLAFGQVLEKEKAFLSSRGANSKHLVGLAFSGGGIRSATFNLGVLQALADKKLLPCFDYLSTVSGGGYIGAWLTALINRRVLIYRDTTTKYMEAKDVTPAENIEAVKDVEEQLLCTRRQTPEPREIHFLRAYSNYLTPKLGLFSLDTLASFSVWLTNTILNQIILIATFLALFALAVLIHDVPNVLLDAKKCTQWIFFGLGFALIAVAIWIAVNETFLDKKHVDTKSLWKHILVVGWLGLVLLSMAGITLCPYWVNHPVFFQLTNFYYFFGITVPLLALIISFMIILLLGLAGRKVFCLIVSIGDREWWSRLGGVSLFIGLICTVLFWVAVYFPDYIDNNYPKLKLKWFSVISYFLAFTFAKLGQSKATGSDKANVKLEMLVKIAPYLVITVMIVLFGYGTHWLINSLTGQQIPFLDKSFSRTYAAICIFGSAVLILFVGGLRFDINLFSLHNFYRNRLTRCYLGATWLRKANPFTGFTFRDDLRFAMCAQRPLHIINTALNISAGKELAWQQRKAASFAFTPLYSGFELPDRGDESPKERGCFRPTVDYNEQYLMTGSLMAVSGAAASPNWGYHTNPAMAFIMTMFNVRLGRWFGNPITKDKWKNQSPWFSWRYLIWELLAQTRETSNYVYLSDGGHFENLGIYELVRRRCRLIVAIDAGQDGKSTFEDLGNAIRKCYTDFGIRIDIPGMVNDVGINEATQTSNKHFTIGEIHYQERYGKDVENGVLVYIKNSLTGDEPADLQNYKKQEPNFPHHSTVDQFFDEMQFESYRNLGYHIAETVFKGVPLTNNVNCEMLIQVLEKSYQASKNCDVKKNPENNPV